MPFKLNNWTITRKKFANLHTRSLLPVVPGLPVVPVPIVVGGKVPVPTLTVVPGTEHNGQLLYISCSFQFQSQKLFCTLKWNADNMQNRLYSAILTK